MSKPFLSFEEQIKHLKDNKNLIIDDDSYAEEMLKQIGYFSLIGGYKMPFLNKTTRKYQEGIRIEEIVLFYRFDETLRELFLKYILRIERHLRSLLSYHFTAKHGESQSAYLNRNNYHLTNRNGRIVDRLIRTLDNTANENSDYPYINHQREMYNNVPLWVLVNALSFGSLSKFYECTTADIQSRVARNFDKVNQRQLEQFLSVMTKFRNVCAHGERLYCYKTRDAIPNTTIHSKLVIEKKGNQYVVGKQDLFAMVVAFRYLLNNEDFKRFKRSLHTVVKTYLRKSEVIKEETLYGYMGFPYNWSRITAYKK